MRGWRTSQVGWKEPRGGNGAPHEAAERHFCTIREKPSLRSGPGCLCPGVGAVLNCLVLVQLSLRFRQEASLSLKQVMDHKPQW